MDFLRCDLALAPRHTNEVAYTKLRFKRWRKCKGRLPGEPAGDGGKQIVSAVCWTNLSGNAGRSPPPFKRFTVNYFLRKINTSNLAHNLAPNLGRTRISHGSQYTIYLAYSDALKNSFFLRTIPKWNCLPSSVVSSKTTEDVN